MQKGLSSPRLLIVQTGSTQLHGDYPRWFERTLGFEMPVTRAHEGEQLGPALDRVRPRGIIVSGSPLSVTEKAPWMLRLGDDLLRAGARGIPVLGVCFGHQAMAQALGGQVIKSPKGWGAGLQRYQVVDPQPWTNGERTVAIPASHQDQVVVQPPNTTVVAASDFTPFAALAWTDRPAISFQFHPEFSPGYAKALIEKRYDRVNDPDAALASLDAPNDNDRVAAWMRRFLEA